jgi:hypothetical protein
MSVFRAIWSIVTESDAPQLGHAYEIPFQVLPFALTLTGSALTDEKLLSQ